jgi:sugar phosphate isomerase/epimerase
MEISVQLYTVRDRTESDMPGTLQELAQIGYRYVELAGYGSLKSAAEMKKAMDDAGVKASGAHVSLDALEIDLVACLADAEVLGHRHLVVPWLAESRRKDATGYKDVAKSLEKFGRAAQAKGICVGYHNHDFEFQVFGGKRGLDCLFDNCDAKIVGAELDVYWVKKGGEYPTDRMKKMGRRVKLVHLKDMTKAGRFAPVGTGTLDFPDILRAARECHTEFGVVEQDDDFETTSMDSVKISWENLAKITHR